MSRSDESESRVDMMDEDDLDQEPLYVPKKIRRLQELHERAARSGLLPDSPPVPPSPVETASLAKEALSQADATAEPSEQEASLVTQHLKLEKDAKAAEAEEDPIDRLKREELELLAQIQRSLSTPLLSVKERAAGITYDDPIQTTWTLPKKYKELTEDQVDRIRERYWIDVQGEDIPPPILKFEHMKLPRAIHRVLKQLEILRPTQIQMQGLPCVLSGRDMIGIAFTGSGKTMVFVIPMVMRALEQELRLPLTHGEGPIGLVMCPSRELASQTMSTINRFCQELYRDRHPRLRTLLLIGGSSVSEQASKAREGVHIMAATPGRLGDMLEKKLIHLNQCLCLAMDEADRLVDLGFEAEIRSVFDRFHHQRQTMLFSATMPRKIQEFATTALIKPVLCNVGRAGAANLDVRQEVEYVKAEARLPYLLQCLQKTEPPVVIFCENKHDVDEVHEYLLLKGVDAVAIHGGMSQVLRTESVELFKHGRKDVLVGTDVASKGLDFKAIKHVINFEMPKEIENYVHRIGRTGRCGKTGVATTFIDKDTADSTLLDLRALLREANQKIPAFLEKIGAERSMEGLDSRSEIGGVRGCAYCGGLGHRIVNCPRLESQRSKQLGGNYKDLLTTGSRYGHASAYGGNW
eukprot:Blabericola_migrator_1__322@NODE_1082_length_5496_cov_1003_158224_g741_i0_p1_GENE_NODE_1082_length_5496_cov_1003_158224_g741_i0NODE_1082_length_5496_cov_1003_158224_g741_i0_p1_ORF_typecomplete_len636_score97_40DEAD/PF00270_29/4_7e45DEAD/PF00270_29/9_8e02Helicase_C/PF00271_31/1_2e28ResIII/PF04851_15/1_1e10ERCC3_RAD25_C/PF16203_5/3e07UTP25/PF06862_12/8_4e02UTP25/PF06862_12/0_0014Helicase_C_4/PF13871_6/0_003AAA_22/PF13401_6/0_0092SecA_DEAD/PF07517_14/7_4e02SecA_DEAD/PF07517_14/0_012AAA_19/PF13245_6